MDWGHKLALEKRCRGALILAEHQSKGRGRRGRLWTASTGQSLLFSVVFEFPMKSTRIPLLTLAAGLALCRSLESLGIRPKIRWPNDIVVNGLKLAGILAESGIRGKNIRYVVLGIGLNVHQNVRDLTEVSRYGATSLVLEKALDLSRVKVLGIVLRALEKIAGQDLLFEGHRGWMRSLRTRSTVMGKRIRVDAEGTKIQGRVVGFGKSGELLVKQHAGKIQQIYSGEISYL